MNFGTRLLYTAACSLVVCGQLYALDIVVTSENDAGLGTLRQAIMDINGGGPESHTITFAPNVTTISLLTPLPPIKNTVTMDGLPAGVDCTQLSPVDKLEEFSAAITVTIDGSQMTPDPIDPIAGLVICANNTIIRGIRVANIASGFNSAFGIAVSSGSNVLIECCEIHDIHGLIDTTGIGILNTKSAVGIQGNLSVQDTIISQCYIHTIDSGSLETSNNVFTAVSTGSTSGIQVFKEVIESRVEKITTGSIIYREGSGNPTLSIGSAIGIAEQALQPPNCNALSKQCACEDVECLRIEHSIVNCCQSGSVFATTSASITLGGSNGIKIIPTSELVINNSRVCNITSGDITLTNATFSVTGNKAIGIETRATRTCLSDNIICSVHRGTLTLGGIHSDAMLGGTYGVKSDGGIDSAVLKNNTISDVTCKTIIAQGICTHIRELSTSSSPACVGNLVDPIIHTDPICSGIYIPVGGLNQVLQNVTLCNNTITNIALGKRASQGTGSLIVSSYAAGIFATTFETITAQYNTIKNIVGAQLIASPESSGIFGGNGCNGIVLQHLTINAPLYNITAQANTIINICENTLHAQLGVNGHYNFPIIDKETTQALSPIAQTNGISVTTNIDLVTLNDMPIGTIIIERNTIRDISGAMVQGGIPGTGTIATGISVSPSISVNFSPGSDNDKDLQQLCLADQNSPHRSYVQKNYIDGIHAGTKNAAYGILLNGSTNFVRSVERADSIIPLLFTIKDNSISHIQGLGTPQPFESTALPSGSSLFPIFPGTCTSGEPVTLLPFPFEPASGIYTIFGNCSTIENNTITCVTHPGQRARGITTQASNDMDIFNNTIFTIHGYGIFIGGAVATLDIINNLFGISNTEQFETFFASTRNQIYSNSTFDNAKQGIELGLIDWNNYLFASLVECGSSNGAFLKAHQDIPEDSEAIFGNHGQPAPRICNIQINRDGTITIDFILDSPKHPLTKFIIQLFANDGNTIPHGKRALSAFDDPACVFRTNFNGHTKTSITFTPIALTHCTDIFSAHVTVATTGQSTTVQNKYKGDTSPFGLQSPLQPCPAVVDGRPSTQSQKPFGWMSIM